MSGGSGCGDCDDGCALERTLPGVVEGVSMGFCDEGEAKQVCWSSTTPAGGWKGGTQHDMLH